MKHTIQLTAEQFQALQSGQPITIEPPTKWEPAGGEFSISNSFSVLGIKTEDEVKKSGMKYKTKAQANSVAKQLRAYARQLAWVSEHYDGWEADWSDRDQNKYYVFYCNTHRKFKPDYCFKYQDLTTIYMSKANATKLAQLMNDGIVEF